MNSPEASTLGPLEDAKSRAVDSLFEDLNHSGSPGLAVGVYQGSGALLLRAYGEADLEHSVLNTPQTVFHVASVSKQFAAFTVALLAREGQVDLDADIRRYLSFVPDFGLLITVRHLLYHTSGLRDQWVLFGLGGQELDNRLRQQQIVNMVGRQRGLNFEPGSEYLYCNTGYTLLAEIVRAVSGKSLREYTTERLFRPLGMTHTFFYDDVTEVVPGRAHSYRKGDDDRWHRALLNYDTVGATSLVTTAEDMVKWVGNFFRPIVGDAALIEQVSTPGALRDRTRINYGFGLKRGSYAGHEAVLHMGADAGFRAVMAYFPGADFGLAMLANYPVEDWDKFIHALTDIHLNGHLGAVKSHRPAEVAGDEQLLRHLPGYYIAEFDPLAILERQGNQIMWKSPGGDAAPVVFRADGTLDRGNVFRSSSYFRPQKDAAGRITALEDLAARANGAMKHYQRIEPVQPTLAELRELTGDYRCPELDITYTFFVEGGHLTARSIWSPQVITFTPSIRDRFDAEPYWMSIIQVIRDHRGRATGLRLHGDRIRNVILERVST
jgi:CubicO group peptidase (beta-lactamase class C family)